MDNEQTPPKQGSDNHNVVNSLSVTKDEFIQYFTRYETEHGELLCPLCKKSEWAVASRDDSAEHMALVTLPIPMRPGRGAWVYPLYCNECGYMVSFMSNLVSKKIKELR